MKNELISAKPICVELTLATHKFNPSETATYKVLSSVDIIAAINYYGITELLDTIGEENLKAHLELDKVYHIDSYISV
ncbi:hypothetical protein [Pedobacter nototheniae]|uniref:hypothetical protein n=1 Tax=Pedobacter nototheniae TaxID=2488994 RepID=UPI00103EBE17|nr:hypothetical protein [Pedobacter nototheniae]